MWSAAAATEADATVICAPGDGVPPSVLLSTPQAQYLFNVPEGARPSPPLPHAPLSVHTLSQRLQRWAIPNPKKRRRLVGKLV
jgi:hypothetical protein